MTPSQHVENRPHDHIDRLIAKYGERVPRYTSYPTAPNFSGDISAETYATWLAALEAWALDPSSWDADRLGPPLNQADNQIPVAIKLRFNDRVRKREARRRDAETATAKRAADDRELRDKLIACHAQRLHGEPCAR